MTKYTDHTRRWIQVFSYAGLLPFVLLAALMWLVTEELHPFVALALVQSKLWLRSTKRETRRAQQSCLT